MPDRTLSNMMSRVRIRASRYYPFFATLVLQAPVKASSRIPVAATDGRTVYINADAYNSYPFEQQVSILLHETLHCALLHIQRRGERDAEIWNIAADIVINGMLRDQGFELPSGAVVDDDLEELPVEEVYAVLMERGPESSLDTGFSGEADLKPGLTEAGGEENSGTGGIGENPGRQLEEVEAAETRRLEEAEEYWEKALATARYTSHQGKQAGETAVGAVRDVERARKRPLDWRRLLWRYLTDSPDDFGSFDRRFVGRRPPMYLETLEGKQLRVFIGVDTSGSVSDRLLGLVLGEVRQILRSYPDTHAELFFFDSSAYGPYDIAKTEDIPEAVGGGGTDVRAFFDAVEAHKPPVGRLVTVCLTDGYTPMPESEPNHPVLWAVTPGGCESDAFPFGRVVRLVDG